MSVSHFAYSLPSCMKPMKFLSAIQSLFFSALLGLCLLVLGVAPHSVWAQTQPAMPVAALNSHLVHSVRKSDTLQKICRTYKLTAKNCQHVAYTNQLDNNKLPDVGKTLYLPLDVLPAQIKPIRVVQTVGTVTVAGQAVKANTRFAEKQTIKVAADSSAVLEMADGSRAKLLPNSVAEVVHSREYTAPEKTFSGKFIHWFGSKIRIVQGALEAAVKKAPNPDQGTPLEVETTTSLLGVRGTRFRVAAADKYVPFDRAEVLRGKVNNINTWRYAQIDLSAGQGTVVNPNTAKMQAVALLPAPAVPEPNQILRRPQAYWEFSPVAGAVAYRVIAAYDADFNSIAYSEKSTTPVVDLSSLSNGKWHVRARAVDATGLEGIDATTSIELRQPAWVLRHPSVNVAGSRPYLMWAELTGANLVPLKGVSTVTVEVAHDAQFQQAIATVKTTGKYIDLPHLPSGTYYLRVAVDNASIQNDEKQTFKLDIPVRRQLGYNVLLRKLS